MSKQLDDDVVRAATITWQQDLIRRNIGVPEAILDPKFNETDRGKEALQLLRQAGVDLKNPWAPPLWNLREKLLGRPPGAAEPKAAKAPRARSAAPKKPAKKAGKKTAKKASTSTKRSTLGSAGKGGSDTEWIADMASRYPSLIVTVATDTKTTGRWTARGANQIRQTLKKALSQAHMLASRGYTACLITGDGTRTLSQQFFDPKEH